MDKPPAEQNDQQILLRDPGHALEKLMTSFGSLVLRTAFFYLGDRHLAEDVSQEVFIRAYRGWHAFRGDSSVRTWLTRITVNLCRDRLRRRSSYEEPTDPVLLHREAPIEVEDEALRELSRTLLLQHLVELPLPYQEVLFLYYYVDLDTRQIAEATGASEGTVRSRLHRARELLGERLREGGFFR